MIASIDGSTWVVDVTDRKQWLVQRVVHLCCPHPPHPVGDEGYLEICDQSPSNHMALSFAEGQE